MIGRLLGERCCDRHLSHHGGAAAADQAALGENHGRAGARGFERSVHACGAGADHQHVGLQMHRLVDGGVVFR